MRLKVCGVLVLVFFGLSSLCFGAKEEWQDKAGAYGIQGAAGIYIREIHGDFYNVMGLPLQELYTHLRKYSYIM